MYRNIESICIVPRCSIQDAITSMNTNRLGIVLVVNENHNLVGTITDGDIRRAVLGRVDLKATVSILLEQKANTIYNKPVFAYEGEESRIYFDLLKKNRLLHLPILNQKNQVVGLVTQDEFMIDPLASLNAVVMAGGKGTRLFPLTEKLPKPMLPLGEKPLLEIIIEQLRNVGIRKVNVTTHHKPEKIQDHFGNGKNFGININYVSEDRPLGTAGALGLLDNGEDQPLLVINGDILTQVDLRAMFVFHKEHQADFTIAVRSFYLDVPYGVIECEGTKVCKVQEKPKMHFLVNAGIYLLESRVREYIPSNTHYHMTDLIDRLVQEKKNVISFPIHESWLDIGAHAEYERAQQEVKKFHF